MKTKRSTKLLLALSAISLLLAVTPVSPVHAARTDNSWNERLGSYLETAWPEGRNLLINGVNKYLNFGTFSGASGYGIRDNAGTMEFKNNGGSWQGIGTGSGSGGATFGQAWELISGFLTPTSSVTTLHPAGLISSASSTIANLSVDKATTTNATTTKENIVTELKLSYLATGLTKVTNGIVGLATAGVDYLASYDPFTHETNYNVTNSATGTPMWVQAGLNASSTSHLEYSSTTAASFGHASTTALRVSGSANLDYLGTGLLKVTSGSVGLATAGTDYLASYNPFTPATNYNVTNSATGTPLWAQAGLNASSTSHFEYASSTALSATSLCLSTDCRTTWPAGGAGGDDPFSHETNYNVTNSSTGTPVWLKAGFNASSTSHLDYSSTTAGTFGHASSTALRVSGSANLDYLGTGLLKVTSGSVGLASAGTDYLASYNPFTAATNYNVTNAATSTPLWAQAGLNASSTSHFEYASSTAVSGTSVCISTDCRTSWPAGGPGGFGQAWEINAGGYLAPTTTVTTLHPGGLVTQASSTLSGGNVMVRASTPNSLLTVIQDLDWASGGYDNYALDVTGYSILGGIRFNGADGVNAAYLSGGQMGFTVDLGQAMSFSTFSGGFSTPHIYIDGAGLVGIGTVTPGAQLSVGAGAMIGSGFTGAAPTNGLGVEGRVGIGTTTPGTDLGIGNTGANTINISASATSTFGSGINVKTGCFAVNGTCISATSLAAVKQYPAFTYSTSTAWTGTTTIPLGPAYVAETWNGVKCFTDTGTVNVSFYDGTNRMNMLNASTTVGTFTLSTNNSFTASEKRYVDVGTPASSPTKISCTVSKTLSIE